VIDLYSTWLCQNTGLIQKLQGFTVGSGKFYAGFAGFKDIKPFNYQG
jgi:hypothetical protein